MTLSGDPTLIDAGLDDPPSHPLVLLKKWMKEAESLCIREPKGLVLSTVDKRGRPSSRVVLLKKIDDRGIIFATSSESAKGRDLAMHPFASGNLWWRETMQQVNFEGSVTRLSEEESDAIFKERPRTAQAVAALTQQSTIMHNESELKDKIAELIALKDPILRPQHICAYHIAPESMEFWLGSHDRFHKRLRYDMKDGSWQWQRLQP
ncbi:MAG: pyridoxal 5'-phosphate synthase [Alphaproteobacteria bacterium]|nr:pyridoxal 5'-phosphate synthase [Alphaproteobacteria bacterium]